MFYPNPKNNNLPFSYITGNDANTVYDFVKMQYEQGTRRRRGFYFQNMDYEIYRGGSKITMGNFDDRWNIDPIVRFDYSTGNDIVAKSDHFNIISHQNSISTENA